LVGAFGCQAVLHEETSPLLGEGAWITRDTPDLSGRWTLLSFFLPDCAGCVDEVPHLKRVRAHYARLGLTVVGITPVSKPDAGDFVDAQAVPYPVLADAGAEFEVYGVREVPDTFLVDPEGVVVARGMEAIQEALFTQFGE
jgi:peroxiredoxin